MTTVQIKSAVSIEINELIDGVSQLDTDQIEHLLSELSIVLAQRKAPSLPGRESILLQKIGEGLADNLQQRYDELQHKVQAETITTEEHSELLHLIDVVEQADAERLQALIELAQLRGVTLDELMTQLGIRAPSAHV